MCFHVALCSITFNLICSMTTFSENIVLTFDLILGDDGVCKESIYTYTLAWRPMFHSL